MRKNSPTSKRPPVTVRARMVDMLAGEDGGRLLAEVRFEMSVEAARELAGHLMRDVEIEVSAAPRAEVKRNG